jgi:hypothetical protein
MQIIKDKRSIRAGMGLSTALEGSFVQFFWFFTSGRELAKLEGL